MSQPRVGNYTVPVIENLIYNLERYQPDDSGFTIIKEFIQNADDAEDVETMHLAWIPGKSESDLYWDSPAFVVINDGLFTEDDLDNIMNLGSFFKAPDENKIGKFGLGMKSLHHWSEAYRFLTWPRCKFDQIVNPWQRDKEARKEKEPGRCDWNSLSTPELDRISRTIEELYRQTETDKEWFCIWMPLRSEKKMKGRKPIRQNWPGDDHIPREILKNGDTPFQVAAFLPMLKKLKSISAWLGDVDETARMDKLFSIAVSSRPILSRFSEPLPEKTTHDVVEIILGDRSSHELPVVGYTRRLDDPLLRECQEEKNWPEKEAVSQDAAVYFIQDNPHDFSSPSFSANMSVFLPLGEPQSVPLRGSRISGVSVFMHGYFFVDSGRREILAPDHDAQSVHKDDEGGVKMRWNRRLLEAGTLPLFLPALNQFVRRVGWSTEKVRTLVEGIVEHRKKYAQTLWKGIDDAMLFDKQGFLCLYAPEMPGKRQWKLVGIDRYFELPEVNGHRETDLEIPEKTFPKFRELAGTHFFVFKNSSRLAAIAPDDKIPDEIIRALLESVDPRTVFGDLKCLDYFVRFVEEHAVSCPTGCLISLWNRIANAIAFDGVEDSPAIHAGKRIAEHIPSEKRFRIPGRIATGALLRSLAMQELEIALVPETIWPTDKTSAAEISFEDAHRLLKALCYWKEQRKREEEELREISLLAAMIWKAADSGTLLERCADMPLFRANNCFEKRWEDCSYRFIRDIHDEKCLFATSGPTIGDAHHLQTALDSSKEKIHVISGETFSILFPGKTLQVCNPRNINLFFREKSRDLSSDLRDRLDLFTRLVGDSVPNNKSAIRFLLHGNASRYESNETIFFPGELGGIFGLLNNILSNEPANRWRYISPSTQRTFEAWLRSNDSMRTSRPRPCRMMRKTTEVQLFSKISIPRNMPRS